MYLTYSPEPGELMEDTLEYVGEVEDELIDREDTEIIQLSVTTPLIHKPL